MTILVRNSKSRALLFWGHIICLKISSTRKSSMFVQKIESFIIHLFSHTCRCIDINKASSLLNFSALPGADAHKYIGPSVGSILEDREM